MLKSPSPGPECICTRAFFCLLSAQAQASALLTHGLSDSFLASGFGASTPWRRAQP
ncbi:hypothetical protein SynA1825c_01977 [Synechococcus sp. A18-25c]|nr:hypothetical protein SynA1825c_01977 [Synechococcus sp. A18-25c]